MRINSALPLSRHDSPQVAVGGRLAEVQYSDASSYPGCNQVNFRMPSGVTHISVRLIYLGRAKQYRHDWCAVIFRGKQ
jgi:uncharacterized protein (TIGR03437 family)